MTKSKSCQCCISLAIAPKTRAPLYLKIIALLVVGSDFQFLEPIVGDALMSYASIVDDYRLKGPSIYTTFFKLCPNSAPIIQRPNSATGIQICLSGSRAASFTLSATSIPVPYWCQANLGQRDRMREQWPRLQTPHSHEIEFDPCGVADRYGVKGESVLTAWTSSLFPQGEYTPATKYIHAHVRITCVLMDSIWGVVSCMRSPGLSRWGTIWGNWYRGPLASPTWAP